ncbi:DUF3102 domain-containing protein [Mesorhizobium sp. L2C084A000]|uniref:DUF3102 domain-containing protein n=1 Tax=Mesorhizobium sp. L2C084A000 TaxID=1287116 RepID=UPI0003D02EE1|nr:DUF3102 domain-containing protein [Mesorhizobium sp. L2C084A000]ESZ30592.1 hypothetical protein X734_03940 [Mesorhizobium sp. L2C084A000]
MTAHASKAIDAEVDDLDLSHAGDGLERLNNEATEADTRIAGNAVPLVLSVGKSFYSELDPAIAKLAEEAAGRIHGQRESVSRNIVEIGKELESIKVKLGHGMFGKWIQAEFEMTAKTAQTYMNVARMVEESGSVLNLNLSDTALQLLAAPNADSVRDELTKTIALDIKAGKPTPKPKRVKEMIAIATGKVTAPTRVSEIGTATTPAKAMPASITPSFVGTSTTPIAEAPQAHSATTPTASVAAKAQTTLPSATPEQVDTAARLMKMLTKVLPKFAKLYDTAGHEVFKKAMAEALKQAVFQPAPEQQAA